MWTRPVFMRGFSILSPRHGQAGSSPVISRFLSYETPLFLSPVFCFIQGRYPGRRCGWLATPAYAVRIPCWVFQHKSFLIVLFLVSVNTAKLAGGIQKRQHQGDVAQVGERSGVSVGHSRDRLLPKFGKRDVMNEVTPYGWSAAGSSPVISF